MKQVIFVLLDRYADWEFAYLAPALRGEVAQGYQVRFASSDMLAKISIGGLTMRPQLTLDEIPEDAHALVLIGAAGSWREDPPERIAQLAHAFKDSGRVVGAICDAARWAGSVGLRNDVRHTLNDPHEMADFPGYTNAQGYLPEESVRDGNIVTANGNAPVAFAANVLRALEAAPEKAIQEYADFYTIGFHAAMKKYGYG